MGQILGETLRMDSADTYFKLLLRPNIRGGGGGSMKKGGVLLPKVKMQIEQRVCSHIHVLSNGAAVEM